VLLAFACVLSASSLPAQENPVHTHIGHVADGFESAPVGQGLLTTAVAEAETAVEHATLAATDPFDLDGIKRHVAHVLHTIDPALSPGGPGLGYGVRRAALSAAEHIELAAAAEGASVNVKTHAVHIAAALGNVAHRADAIIALTKQLEAATSAEEAASPLAELGALCGALVQGRDGDGDGRVGWQAGEGGLRQATQHMTLMKLGEGLIE
jgi:hypothetical protein